ncbi:MAG: FAD binding domain-containing protein, partial [Candidatus Edwardsbacteria bacterium]|nr:FAD binding domain-containing protein [Candidatus Edwardsbacteria bacterium]
MPDKIRKLKISFFLNDRAVSADIFPDDTALKILRARFGLTGTKEGCNEGDCGACTIAIGEMGNGSTAMPGAVLTINGKWEYRAYTSCLLPAARLHGKHVITIEGLAEKDRLHPIQQAMLDHHATQCGFCTPGVIMSLFCLFARNFVPNFVPSQRKLYDALEGNLCRCTGYLSIREAGESLSDTFKLNAGDIKGRILPAYCAKIAKQLESFNKPVEFIEIPKPQEKKCLAYHLPASLEELFDILWKIGETAEYRVICGGTDVMADANVKGAVPKHLVDISQIRGLRFIREEGDKIVIGANTTLTNILESPAVKSRLPLLWASAAQMASLQIRNIATLAGNLAAASAIGDAGTALLALNAVAVLTTKMGERIVPVENFYKGYRQTELCAHEVITAIEVPVINAVWDFQKSAKRSAVDISSVSSGFVAQVEGPVPSAPGRIEGKRIVEARIAYGGVAPTPVLASKTMELLKGKVVDKGLIKRAAQMAESEVTPISDVRGSKEYRGALVRNHLAKHLTKLL